MLGDHGLHLPAESLLVPAGGASPKPDEDPPPLWGRVDVRRRRRLPCHRVVVTTAGIDVRRAGVQDLAELAAVERAADELFVPLGITDLPPPPPAAERARAWRVLVAGRPVRGFAVLELVDGAVHHDR